LDTSNFNAAYDVWFTATEADLPVRQASPGKGGAYLMVWMFDPRDRQPRGGAPDADGKMGPNVAAHTIPGVDGTWDVWIDKTDPLCISYVRTTPTDGMAFDLNTFIRDSVTNSYGITSSMYLAIVFAGFEVWGGGDGLKLKQFCAAVN
jgi:cellulose 1,4-beta-cellobiosidase